MASLVLNIDILGAVEDYASLDHFPPHAQHVDPIMLGEGGKRFYDRQRDSRESHIAATSSEESHTMRIADDIVTQLAKKIIDDASNDDVKKVDIWTREDYSKGLMVARCVECFGGPVELVRRNRPDQLNTPIGRLYAVVLGMLYEEHSVHLSPVYRRKWPSEAASLISGVNAIARQFTKYRELPKLIDAEMGRIAAVLDNLSSAAVAVYAHVDRSRGAVTLGMRPEEFAAITPEILNRKRYEFGSTKIEFPRDILAPLCLAMAVEQYSGIDGVIQNYAPEPNLSHEGVNLRLSAYIADCYIHRSHILNSDEFVSILNLSRQYDDAVSRRHYAILEEKEKHGNIFTRTREYFDRRYGS